MSGAFLRWRPAPTAGFTDSDRPADKVNDLDAVALAGPLGCRPVDYRPAGAAGVARGCRPGAAAGRHDPDGDLVGPTERTAVRRPPRTRRGA